ncbi:MAG: hypothetical protein AB1782_15815 [Cyanobacteriota bacterium]
MVNSNLVNRYKFEDKNRSLEVVKQHKCSDMVKQHKPFEHQANKQQIGLNYNSQQQSYSSSKLNIIA